MTTSIGLSGYSATAMAQAEECAVLATSVGGIDRLGLLRPELTTEKSAVSTSTHISIYQLFLQAESRSQACVLGSMWQRLN